MRSQCPTLTTIRITAMTMRFSPTGLVINAVLELNGEWQAKQTISGDRS